VGNRNNTANFTDWLIPQEKEDAKLGEGIRIRTKEEKGTNLEQGRRSKKKEKFGDPDQKRWTIGRGENR